MKISLQKWWLFFDFPPFCCDPPLALRGQELTFLDIYRPGSSFWLFVCPWHRWTWISILHICQWIHRSCAVESMGKTLWQPPKREKPKDDRYLYDPTGCWKRGLWTSLYQWPCMTAKTRMWIPFLRTKGYSLYCELLSRCILVVSLAPALSICVFLVKQCSIEETEETLRPPEPFVPNSRTCGEAFIEACVCATGWASFVCSLAANC